MCQTATDLPCFNSHTFNKLNIHYIFLRQAKMDVDTIRLYQPCAEIKVTSGEMTEKWETWTSLWLRLCMKASMKSLMPCSRKYCYSSLKSVIHPEPPCVTCVQCNVCRNEGETRLSVRKKVRQFSICSISVTEGYSNPAAMTHILRFLKAEVSESVYTALSLSFW